MSANTMAPSPSWGEKNATNHCLLGERDLRRARSAALADSLPTLTPRMDTYLDALANYSPRLPKHFMKHFRHALHRGDVQRARDVVGELTVLAVERYAWCGETEGFCPFNGHDNSIGNIMDVGGHATKRRTARFVERFAAIGLINPIVTGDERNSKLKDKTNCKHVKDIKDIKNVNGTPNTRPPIITITEATIIEDSITGVDLNAADKPTTNFKQEPSRPCMRHHVGILRLASSRLEPNLGAISTALAGLELTNDEHKGVGERVLDACDFGDLDLGLEAVAWKHVKWTSAEGNKMEKAKEDDNKKAIKTEVEHAMVKEYVAGIKAFEDQKVQPDEHNKNNKETGGKNTNTDAIEDINENDEGIVEDTAGDKHVMKGTVNTAEENVGKNENTTGKTITIDKQIQTDAEELEPIEHNLQDIKGAENVYPEDINAAEGAATQHSSADITDEEMEGEVRQMLADIAALRAEKTGQATENQPTSEEIAEDHLTTEQTTNDHKEIHDNLTSLILRLHPKDAAAVAAYGPELAWAREAHTACVSGEHEDEEARSPSPPLSLPSPSPTSSRSPTPSPTAPPEPMFSVSDDYAIRSGRADTYHYQDSTVASRARTSRY